MYREIHVVNKRIKRGEGGGGGRKNEHEGKKLTHNKK